MFSDISDDTKQEAEKIIEGFIKGIQKDMAYDVWEAICTDEHTLVNWGNYKTGNISGSIPLWAVRKILEEQFGLELKKK